MSDIDADLVRRVVQLERRLRIALIAAAVGSAFCVLAIFGAIATRAIAAPAVETPARTLDVLRVRQLDVVDKTALRA